MTEQGYECFCTEAQIIPGCHIHDEATNLARAQELIRYHIDQGRELLHALSEANESRIKLANHVTHMAERFEQELGGAIKEAKKAAWWEGHDAGVTNARKDGNEEWVGCPYGD